jgi:hypothetical protein
MTEISFGICAALLYLGLVILCVDPWIEPGLRKRSMWVRCIPSLIVLVPMYLFTRYVVLLPSPLNISATDYNGEFSEKRTIAGVEMKPAYSTLHVLFSNPTDYDYKDLDFVIATEEYVVAAEQNGTLPGVWMPNTQT